MIGAGPAGSSAARSAALNGAKTLFIDKKEEVGNPVKCAEGIGDFLFPYLPFKIPKEQLIWEMDGMFFWTDDISIEKRGDFWKGHSVDRIKFDKWVSEEAVNTGAELWKNAELLDLEIDEEDNVKTAIVKKDKKNIKINPKIVIAADGSESTVLKLLDLYHPKEGDIADVYTWEMKNLNLYKPHLEQIYIGEFTPSGYAYIFPKSKNVANVGIGGVFPNKKIEKYFEEFLELDHIKKQVKNGEYVIEKTKKTPWRDISNGWVVRNVIITGDAANQTLKPLGEGILPGIIIGNIAGKLAIKKLAGEDVNNKIYLEHIEKILNPYFMISRENLEKVHYWFTNLGKEKHLLLFSLVSDLFEFERFEELEKMNYQDLKTKILKEIR